MHSLRHFILAIGAMLLKSEVNAQRTNYADELREFSEQRIQHEKTLGLTLGSFALANIAVGAVAAGQTTGETKYFHQMNVYWNLVNLSLAGIGLLKSRKAGVEAETLADAVQRQESIKQILLINAGLDVAYVVGGAYLRERAQTELIHAHLDKANQLRGYGKSIMLQGGFLLAFDLANFFIFKKQGNKQERLLLSTGPNGLGVRVPIR